ncbi:TadE-like protein [Kineococcus xinjiangensis]|uniref:TadE-like protein n=1 Tax=Kineococcus xinjiangensis TaxID=512762 RepID=A0A2S6IFE1_9ACTN|nr:TadE family type IV pilus minor pilin [Kineococcus xinjiangensis]PPK92934.1 TadE-like protein [Kineococcus xinjiangensis]
MSGRRARRGGAVGASAAGARGDRGSVTAELALALPAVVLVLCAVLATGEVAIAQVRCTDAARAAARSAARGEPAHVVRAAAETLAPAGARVEVGPGGLGVQVSVEVAVDLGGRLGGRLPVRGHATAALEHAGAGQVGAGHMGAGSP